MPTSPVTVTFPARPEYLRLARIATADAASRAGLDYEEIGRRAHRVSELCSVVSLDPGRDHHAVVRGHARGPEVSGTPATGTATVAANQLSQAIIAAWSTSTSLHTDAGQTRFHVTKRARRTGTDATTQAQRGLSLRRPGREGPARGTCPAALRGQTRPGKNRPTTTIDRMLLRRRLLLLFVAIVAGVVVTASGRSSHRRSRRSRVSRCRSPWNGSHASKPPIPTRRPVNAGMRSPGRRRSWSPTSTAAPGPRP